MKHYRIALLIAVMVTAFLAVVPASASQRCVLMEDFTNASCPPCAAVNPSLRAMAAGLTHDTCVVVTYHVWWPGADPMYNWNTPEVTTRVNYYNWNPLGVPHARVDGTYGMTPGTSNITQLRNYIRTRYFVSSPCTLDFSAIVLGETSIQVTGSVTAETGDLAGGSIRLFAALITDTMQYSSPPGSNGETLFPDVFRDMWPSATGQPFSIGQGETYDFQGTLNCDASWDPDELSVIVWVQDYTTKAIHQAGFAHVSRNYGLITESTDARQQIVDPASGDVSYFVDLTNIGALDDIYDADLEGAFPEGWSHWITGIDLPTDPDHIQVPLASGQQTTLMVTVNPNGNPGSVDLTVHISSPNEPLISSDESFRLMSGLDVLLVDDDEGSNYETWYEDALANLPSSPVWGRWDVNMSALAGNALNGVDVVVWFTGDSWQDGHTITADDQFMLQNYLDAGGLLFLSGQGIGFDCRTDQFFTDYLHATYNVNYSTGHNLLGIPGDPISDGLDFAIVGGDGANNQIRQSSISPRDEFATETFDWETPPSQGGFPALRIETPTYRVVYLGFGFEAIDNAPDRTEVMNRAFAWLTGTTSADDPRETIPQEFALGQNYPNPFNPETNIPYMLPDRALVTLHVFDLLGREVATLSPGLQNAGVHEIRWDASAEASGIYFYRLDAASGSNSWSATRKLMLLK